MIIQCSLGESRFHIPVMKGSVLEQAFNYERCLVDVKLPA